MKKFITVSALALATLVPGAASASSIDSVTVKSLAIELGSSVAVITLNATAKFGVTPTCQLTQFPITYGWDISTPKGKALLALAQAALLSGKKVIVAGAAGSNTCTTRAGTTTTTTNPNSGYETLVSLEIKA
jgi:hypothetical protein